MNLVISLAQISPRRDKWLLWLKNAFLRGCGKIVVCVPSVLLCHWALLIPRLKACKFLPQPDFMVNVAGGLMDHRHICYFA